MEYTITYSTVSLGLNCPCLNSGVRIEEGGCTYDERVRPFRMPSRFPLPSLLLERCFLIRQRAGFIYFDHERG
jgi:hypothetical protein